MESATSSLRSPPHAVANRSTPQPHADGQEGRLDPTLPGLLLPVRQPLRLELVHLAALLELVQPHDVPLLTQAKRIGLREGHVVLNGDGQVQLLDQLLAVLAPGLDWPFSDLAP